jgi:nucleoside diphosphate kinase
MASNRTFTMIKPDAVRAGNIGNILQMINAAGFRIVALKLTQMSMERAGQFYEVHAARPFYGELCEFMSSGPIVAAILEKDNAVEDFRKLIGAPTRLTPKKAPSANCTPPASAKMPYMARTATKTQRSKARFTLPEWSYFKAILPRWDELALLLGCFSARSEEFEGLFYRFLSKILAFSLGFCAALLMTGTKSTRQFVAFCPRQSIRRCRQPK